MGGFRVKGMEREGGEMREWLDLGEDGRRKASFRNLNQITNTAVNTINSVAELLMSLDRLVQAFGDKPP